MNNQRVDPSYLLELQHNVEKIRNFCILAHVDHGKTTLSDSLVSSNGIISQRLAGKLRFLDSTEEEQKRGITMHSSAIALLYRLEDKSGAAEGDGAAPATEEYLINLVDSPGHIDFSSDVSTAARLCDGALIVVDVLEGVCTQTHAVVYKALRERMRPCLVLNKIDRLIVELKLTPYEAFQHLRRLLENVNALSITLVRSELMKEMDENKKEGLEIDDEHPLIMEWTFSPEKGNVQFASALDGWGFGLMKFINYYHKKLGLNKNILRKYLFDDYSINLETKKIIKLDSLSSSSSSSSSSSPMFVTLVLEPLWEIYSLLILQNNLQEGLTIMKEKFNIQLINKEINQKDLRITLQSIMRKWLPLADSLLRMVVKNMPNPRDAQKQRVSTLLSSMKSIDFLSSLPFEVPSSSLQQKQLLLRERLSRSLEKITHSIETCSATEDSPLVIFISKMMSIRVADLSKEDISFLNAQRQQKCLANNTDFIPLKTDEDIFMALGRIFSGVLKKDSDPLMVLGHKHDPVHVVNEFLAAPAPGGITETELEEQIDKILADPHFIPSMTKSTVSEVVIDPATGGSQKIGSYLLLGPSAFPGEVVPAGNIVGIIGLDDYILKTATITNSWMSFPLKSMTFQSKPMLKVAVEPISHKDLKAIEKGLQSLFQYDPAVEIGMEDNGQHTMTCLGELHLDQCVKALTERFAKCEVKVSEPLVSFRETILPSLEGFASSTTAGGSETTTMTELPPPWSDIPGLYKAKEGTIRVTLDSLNIALTIKCFPVPINTANFLEVENQFVNNLDEYLSQSYSHPISLSNESLCFVKDYLEKKKEFQILWDQFLRSFQDLPDEPSSSSRPAEGGQGVYNEYYLYDDHGESSISPGERKEKYISTLISALQCNQFEECLPSSSSSSSSGVFAENLISVGPKSCPTNLLFFSKQCTIAVTDSLLEASCLSPNILGEISKSSREHARAFHKIWNRLHNSVMVGFQEAVQSGLIMHEPIFGIGYAIQRIDLHYAVIQQILSVEEQANLLPNLTQAPPLAPSDESNNNNTNNNTSTMGLDRLAILPTGQLISEIENSLRLILLSCPIRILEPIYQCNLQCDQQQLGNLYAVLSRRRGHVYSEDIIEGTSMFLLFAYLPVLQSFQFTSELLKKTSGSGTAPQLSFSHWKLILQDPFWKPRTEEEKEEYGDLAYNEHNLAKLSINAVRKRKGLPIDEQIVQFAEKQRTLNKKK